MSSRIFLQTLLQKLKGGNLRSIHLNALPSRFVGRLDIQSLDQVEAGLAKAFLHTILSESAFSFRIHFSDIDLNLISPEEQKQLLVLSKRLNAIVNDNEDYYKDHGMRTLGFGYPMLIKRSTKDPNKVIKAPLFIWPLDAVKSKKKVNEWLFLRNKVLTESDRLVDADLHPVARNEVLASFIKGEDGIELPSLPADMVEDGLIDESELLRACTAVLHALNPGSEQNIFDSLKGNFTNPLQALPDAAHLDQLANNNAYIHFGGVLGLFRAQKESIITDIGRLLERFDSFAFDNLQFESLSTTPFSAVDTDPSQQAILGGLGQTGNQVIQGPPGTGKSQSLTALITNALANDLKCLVVCEKKTALDVIRQNLKRKNESLASLVAVIDDINEDREAIIDSVRERQDKLPTFFSPSLARMQYETASRSIAGAAEAVNAQHRALAKALYRGQTWTQLVGRFLQLKRLFGGVPLKSLFEEHPYKFEEESMELYETAEALKRADSLYQQTKDLHAVLADLHEGLFTDHTIGEARLKVDRYLNTLRQEIPSIESQAHQIEGNAKEWLTNVLPSFPSTIREEVRPYLPLLDGVLATDRLFPDSLPMERFIEETFAKLDGLQSGMVALTHDYQEQLAFHYRAYGDSVNDCLSEYFEFVEENTQRFGPFWLRNDRWALLQTRLLSVVSEKYREMKACRVAVKGRITEIRQTHVVESYIEHIYNDNEETLHLGFYIQNIRELSGKVQAWQQTTPHTIGQYLDHISETTTHPSCAALKSRVCFLLNEFMDLQRMALSRCGIAPGPPVSSLQSLEEQAATFRSALQCYLQDMTTIREQCEKRAAENRGLTAAFTDLADNRGGLQVLPSLFPRFHSLPEVISGCGKTLETVSAIEDALLGFRGFHEWQRFRLQQPAERRMLIDRIGGLLATRWSEAFECWYLFTLLTLYEPPNLPEDDYELQQFKEQKKNFNTAQVNSLLARWTARQQEAVQRLKEKGLTINSLFNKKGSRGTRRNSLRNIVGQEFSLFTDFFPVLLVNPSVCSSVLPLEEGLFDLVIFDEASQLRLEETYPALLRGKAKIISGDKHQMPPSSYFQTGGAMLDPSGEESDLEEKEEEVRDRQALDAAHRNLADSESLLTYAEDMNYRQQFLDIHYRSKHPFLIDFSNHAFYGMRLIPVPPREHYTPIVFLPVDGVYTDSTNPAEARKVIDLLENHIGPLPDGMTPSVGVATFNLYQRNLILDEIAKRRQESSTFDARMIQLGDTFFVKNLENIQGDERDIMIISTTFGKKENGKFTQQFGPVIQSKGHRMLNVIITRAKFQVFVCSSLPGEYIHGYSDLLRQHGNRGRAVLYAYLAYAQAVSDGNEDLRKAILENLSAHCSEKFYEDPEPGIGSESPFEDEVYSTLARHIGAERIVQQHTVGGFRIDMAIRSTTTDRPFIAIECDGAKYHSSAEAYAWDMFRQEQLEKYGFVFHRIWSTNWWDAEERETEKLVGFIREEDAKEMGRQSGI